MISLQILHGSISDEFAIICGIMPLAAQTDMRNVHLFRGFMVGVKVVDKLNIEEGFFHFTSGDITKPI